MAMEDERGRIRGEIPATEPETSGAGRARLRQVRDWVIVFVVALVAALTIRTFAFQAFRIPSPSMEKTLLVGDYVLVSKLHYGPRLPFTLGVPLTEWYVKGVQLPYLRLPGFSTIRRGDVIVFNYPAEDGPIDRKQHYVKRLIALPGDTLRIVDKVTYINGKEMPMRDEMQQRWVVEAEPGRPFPVERLRARGGEVLAGRPGRGASGRIAVEATRALAEEVASWDAVASVAPYVLPPHAGLRVRTFPPGSGFGPDFYGPLYVPARGDTLTLTAANWSAFLPIIRRYEGHDARRIDDDVFEIDGKRTRRYVVEQNYFFVMGDNRDNSQDSRVWGFVPEDHLVGKAVLIYFSWDRARRKPRTDRLLRVIH